MNNGVLEITNKMVIRGKTMKVLRIIKNITLRDMEKATGISIGTLSAMENETRSVSTQSQLRLTRFLLEEMRYTPEEVLVIQAFIQQKEG